MAAAYFSDGVTFWNALRQLLAANLLTFGMVISCLVIVFFDIKVDYTSISLSVTYCFANGWNLMDLTENIGSVEQNMISVERLNQYLKNEVELTETNNENMEDETSSTHQIDPENIISFKDVLFSYQSPEDQNRKHALKKISFTIKKGEKVAFCGRTGSGKSSILNVLFQLYDHESGDVFVKGRNVKNIPLKQLRRSMAIIPQFGFLFKSTLQENLDPLNTISPDHIKSVFHQTGMKIQGLHKDYKAENNVKGDTTEQGQTNKIVSLNVNQSENSQFQQLGEPLLLKRSSSEHQATGEIDLNFEISNSGSNLSNGQKQMINFMRVFIHETEIVCLDEANSNIDPATDEILMKALFKLCKDKAMIMVSHRLDNLGAFDKIVVLAEGQIREMGTFQELTMQPDSYFNMLRAA